MRIWSLHPKYLDAKGIVALWRETLLAKHVLEGRTKGYTNHPQLLRFSHADKPLDAINEYLCIVYKEAVARNYNFDGSKFCRPEKPPVIYVNKGQMEYEFAHLLSKLEKRDVQQYETIRHKSRIVPHPIFKIVKGPIESWEIIKK